MSEAITLVEIEKYLNIVEKAGITFGIVLENPLFGMQVKALLQVSPELQHKVPQAV